MNINNLMFVIVDCSLLSNDERDKMFYQTFESMSEVKKHINKVMNKEVDTNSIEDVYFYGLNEFVNELNADSCPLIDDFVIPIFVKNANTEQPNVLVEKLTQEVQSALKTQENDVKTNFTDMLYDVFVNARNEIYPMIKENGNSVSVCGNIYSVSDDGLSLLKNGEIFNENIYGRCEILDDIRKELGKKDDINTIVDKILSMDVDSITAIMKHIGKFGGHEEIRTFNQITSMLFEANAKGFDVKVELECGRDYYAYGVLENGVIVIRGLADERKEFEEILDIYNTAQVILNDKDYIEFVNECYTKSK